jgi:hypothetical protein
LNLKSIDWRFFQRLANPNAASDLNVFLEKLPQNAGNTVLMAAGIAWGTALAAGLYASMQAKDLVKMRQSFRETTALQPMVPKINESPVSQQEVKDFVQTLLSTYPGLIVKQQGAEIYIASASTGAFGEFREAVGHVQNGGSGWHVSVDRLCVGRECTKDQLAILLKIGKVSVDKPAGSTASIDPGGKTADAPAAKTEVKADAK